MRVLVIGGTGTFGGRLVRLLAGEAHLTLLVAGRSLASAQAFCAEGAATQASLVPTRFDRTRDPTSQLAALAPDIVIDASGPFQIYGDDPYALVKACLTCRAHYIDLADDTGFVAGIARFDDAAREAGVAILAGASTVPALSFAAIRHLTRDGMRVREIAVGIAPSPRADIGSSVVRAVASYAGKTLRIRRGGRDETACALIDARRATIAPPGAAPLPSIRFSLVDVPDLALAPAVWPELETVWVGAGPRPALWHRSLTLAAWLVRLRIVPTLAPLAPLFHTVLRHVRWGAHRGGMFVEVRDGAAVRAWHLIAEGDDGPFIPAMAACALIRKHLDGAAPAPGARACVADLELEDFEPLFAQRRIVSGAA